MAPFLPGHSPCKPLLQPKPSGSSGLRGDPRDCRDTASGAGVGWGGVGPPQNVPCERTCGSCSDGQGSPLHSSWQEQGLAAGAGAGPAKVRPPGQWLKNSQGRREVTPPTPK